MASCGHETVSLRYKADSFGRRLYLMQCDRCGKATTQFLPHDQVGGRKAEPFDLELERSGTQVSLFGRRP
jgi:hypothetical protein